MATSMRQLRYLALIAAVCAAGVLSSCGDSDDKAYPVRTYNVGERVAVGHIVYVVYETQWMTHLGDTPDARVPQSRFFLIRMSALNTSSGDVTVPNFTIEDDSGHSYPELSDGANVPQYIGYLRKVKAGQSVQGHALFDAPPRHYKLKLMDENGEKSAMVDIPLSFTSESPEVPSLPDGSKK
jgi:hypothetical protein